MGFYCSLCKVYANVRELNYCMFLSYSTAATFTFILKVGPLCVCYLRISFPSASYLSLSNLKFKVDKI